MDGFLSSISENAGDGKPIPKIAGKRQALNEDRCHVTRWGFYAFD